MGMTDAQFASFRRQELQNYEDMLAVAEESNADKKLIAMIKKQIELAKKDTEK